MSDTKVNVLPELPASVDNALQNVTDLPTKGIGQTLSDCWFLAFGGISQLAEKRRVKYAHELENFRKELQNSLDRVPAEFKKEPSSQIVLKTLEEAKYCVEEEELRNLFTTLLTSATDTRKDVHPSFAQIIGQMSPNDAKILQCFKHKRDYAICDLKSIIDESGAFITLDQNIFIYGPQSMTEEEKTLSITSLIRLGLLEIPWGQSFTDPQNYEGFKQTNAYINALRKYPANSIEFEEKLVRLTPLGLSFTKSCLPYNI